MSPSSSSSLARRLGGDREHVGSIAGEIQREVSTGHAIARVCLCRSSLPQYQTCRSVRIAGARIGRSPAHASAISVASCSTFAEELG
eukprot:2781139-Rhodomonas_salina.1